MSSLKGFQGTVGCHSTLLKNHSSTILTRVSAVNILPDLLAVKVGTRSTDWNRDYYDSSAYAYANINKAYLKSINFLGESISHTCLHKSLKNCQHISLAASHTN